MIQSIDNAAFHYHEIPQQRAAQSRATEVEEVSKETGVPGPQTEQRSLPAEKGVLRLLQEGHFQGVSAVRLRLNFGEELAEIGSSESLPSLEPEAPMGNGKAYRKFLDQYLSTQAVLYPDAAGVPSAPTVDSEVPQVSVDLTV